jgi:hypothetical protein
MITLLYQQRKMESFHEVVILLNLLVGTKKNAERFLYRM